MLGANAFIERGGPVEQRPAVAAHEGPRMTMYDRTADVITLNRVERTSIWLSKHECRTTTLRSAKLLKPVFTWRVDRLR